MSRGWWRGYFDDAYFQLHDPLFPESESRREVGAMLELLGLPQGARVLDLPCGWGRHTTLLAEAGLDAWGADLSFDLLKRARQREADLAAERDEDEAEGAASTATPIPFVAADLRELPFADASFDAVLNVYTSLGLFLDDDEDLRALVEARRLLRSNGVFLLESMHRDDVIAAYANRDDWELPDGTRVRVRRRFDAVTGISYEALRWRRGEESGRKSHALRLRTATEIDTLLRAAGFVDVEWFGDWDFSSVRHDSPRVIALATRRGMHA